MNRSQIFQKPVVSMPIIIVLNTVAMIWLGLLAHFQQSKNLVSGLFFLILYLLICEFWQLLGRNMYYHHRQFAMGIYIGKLIISLIFIVIISCQSRWSIGLLLVMYELYQLLLYRNDFCYMVTPYFPFLTAFFKGFVMSVILSVGVPFNMSWSKLGIYVIPMLIFFLVAILYQIMYNAKKYRMGYYMMLTGGVIIVLIVMLIHAFTNPWMFLKMALFIAYFMVMLYIFKKTKTKRLEQEVCVSLFALLSMMTCTFL